MLILLHLERAFDVGLFLVIYLYSFVMSVGHNFRHF